MTRRRLAFAAVLAVSLCLSLFGHPPVATAQQAGLAVSPAIFEMVTTPAKTYTQPITVKNITSSPLPIKVSAREHTVLKGVTFIKDADASVFNVSAWLKFDKSDFILKAGEEKTVSVSITPPAKASPGSHYTTIVFSPVIEAKPVPGQSAVIATEVGSEAFITVPGDLKETARVTKPAKVSRLQHFGPLNLTFNLENTGNVHNVPSGKFVVTDYFGHQVDTVNFTPHVILPGTVSPLEFSWGKMWLLNRYTIKPELAIGSPATAVPAETVTIWVVPFVPLGAAAIFLLVFFIFWLRTRKRWGAAWRILFNKKPPRSKAEKNAEKEFLKDDYHNPY